MCISNMLLFLAFQLMLPTIPIYLSDHGGTRSMIGLITGIIAFAAVLIRLFTGYALDNYNRRSIVIVGSLVFAFAASSFTFSLSAVWIVVSSSILGAAWGVMTVAYATIVSGLIPPGRQGSGIGTFLIFGLASMAVGPFLGAWIYNEFGTWALFGTSFVIALLSLFVYLYRNDGGSRAAIDIAGDSDIEAADARATDTETASASGARDNRRFLEGIFEKSALFPALLMLLFMFGFGGILAFAGLYGQALGLANGGIFLLLSNTAAIMIRPIAGKLFDTNGPASVLIPGIVIAIAALFMLSNASGPAAFLVAAIVYGLAFGAVQPYSQAWAIQRARPTRHGAATSTFLIGMDVGVALGSSVLGFWTEAWGYAGIFRVAAFVVIAQLVVYGASVLMPSQRRPQRTVGRT